ncbi:hypothetical protein EJB05_56366, partial [Eragrostis curvula]
MRYQATHRHPGDPAPAALPRSPALTRPPRPPLPCLPALPRLLCLTGAPATGEPAAPGDPPAPRRPGPCCPPARCPPHSRSAASVDLLLGKAYSDWGHINDAVSVYDQLISEHPEDFHPYLAKVLMKILFFMLHLGISVKPASTKLVEDTCGRREATKNTCRSCCSRIAMSP